MGDPPRKPREDLEGFLHVQGRTHKQRIQLNPSNYQKRLLNSAFFQRLFFSVAQPSGVWNEIEYPSTRSHPTAPLGMHFTGTKKKTSPCINCLARFCQCHFSFAHLAIFLFYLFFCLCTVRRRLKSLEEEVQKLEEEQQLGLTLCLLIWMMWMLLPSWERAASRSLRPLWQFFEDEDFPNFPRWDLPVFLEDQYFFSEYMIHAVSMQLCSFLLLGGLLGLP